MSNDVAQMKGLVHLSGLTFRAAQANMAAILARETALRLNLLQLTESKAAQAEMARQSGEAALIAGADIRWHHWVDQRRATINTELAQVLALKDNCHAKLKITFGRDQAACALLDKLVRADQIKVGRRADYES
jgi:hypothetical protein